MWELFTHPSNIAFSTSLCLMFLFGIFEVILTIIGGGSQSLLDQILADDPAPQAETALDAKQGFAFKLLDWLYLGRIPLFIWLIIFLTAYGLTGFIIQGAVLHWTNMLFNVWLISIACIFLCMPIVRACSKAALKFLPQDETTAIYSDELIGRTATIILGEARPNYPAQAKVTDQHGLTHYVLVEPEAEAAFSQGQSVVLTQKTRVGFQGISC